MITIKDIAKVAGVSQGTVSNVLNKKGNVSSKRIKMVEDAIAALGYTANESAKLLRKGLSSDLAVVLPNLDSRCYTDFYNSFMRRSNESGYDVRLYLTQDNSDREKKIASDTRSSMVRGAAIISTLNASTSTDPFLGAGFQPQELLYVERRPFEHSNYIGFDYIQCADQMAKTALRKGFHSVILLTESTDFYNQKIFADTFHQVVTKNSNCQITHVQTSVSRGYNTAMGLFDSRRQPEAVFVSTWELAQQVKSVLYNFFDIKRTLVYTASPLYTMPENQFYKFEMDYRLLGNAAAERLINQLSDSDDRRPVLLPTILPVEGTRIWAHYAEGNRHKRLTFATLDTPEAEILQNLSYLYTKATNTEVSFSVFSYKDLRHILNHEKGGTFDILRIESSWLSRFSHKAFICLDELDPDIGSMFYRFCPGLEPIYARNRRRRYAVPFCPAPQLLFYRKDFFESSILKRQYFEEYHKELLPPENYEDFNRIARFFSRQSFPSSPTLYGATLTAGNEETAAIEFLARYLSRTDSLFNYKNQLSLDPGLVRAALHDLDEIRSCCCPGLDSWWENSALDFAQGNAAMTILFANYASELTTAGSLTTDKIGFSYVPGSNSLPGGASLGINKNSTQKEEALDFIKWLCRDEISAAITYLGSTAPCKKAYENYEVLDTYPWLASVPKQFASGLVSLTPPDPSCPFDGYRLLEVIGRDIRRVLKQEMTLQKAQEHICQSCAQTDKS